MFRKRSSKPSSSHLRVRKRRLTDEMGNNVGDDVTNDNNNNKEDEDEDDDDTSAVQRAIREVQKKQKILSSLPLTSGGGAGAGAAIGIGPPTSDGKRGQGNFRTNIGEGYTGTGNSNTNRPSTSELSVLATKHKKNMEEFIEQHLASTTAAATATTTTSNTTVDGNALETGSVDGSSDAGGGGSAAAIVDEIDLYQQMAREIYTGSQGGSQQQQNQHDDDKGAVLVGSGIAEVILPMHERLASLDRPPAGKKGGAVAGTATSGRNKHYPSSSSAVPDGERNSLPSTTPTPVGRNMMMQHLHRPQHPEPNQHHQNQPTPNNNNTFHKDSHQDSQNLHAVSGSGNDDQSHGGHRRGFADFLGKTPAGDDANRSSSSSSHHQPQQHVGNGPQTTSFRKQNRDDQVFSKFVTRHFQENRR